MRRLLALLLLAPLAAHAQGLVFQPSSAFDSNFPSAYSGKSGAPAGFTVGGNGADPDASLEFKARGSGSLLFSSPSTQSTATVTGTLTVNGPRSASQTDDSTAPASFAVGNSWQDSFGRTFQAQDVTTGFAMWQQVQSAVLPGDVVGLNVSTATYVSGSSGCTVNEVLTFTGGAQIKVTACAGSVPSAFTITQSRMHACMPGTPTAISPLATTGGDGSSVWNLTIQSPVAMYGMRLLTRCYAGKALNVTRSDTGEASDIGFLSTGALDTATLDGFVNGGVPMAQYATYTAGVNPRVATWYDQSGLAHDATQSTANDRPTIFPGRQMGNSRTMMFDGRMGGSSWDPPFPTFLTLPSGVTVTANNFTLAVLGAAATNFQSLPPSFVHIGAQSGNPIVYLATGQGGTKCQPNISTVFSIGIPDQGALLLCSASGSGTTFSVGQFTSTGAAGNATAPSGGTLGEIWNASQSNPIDEAMAIVVPWAMTAVEQQALQASVAATFGVAPQSRGVLIAIGDSHVDAWGYPYQQTFLRQAWSILGRQDITFVNAALAGGQISAFIGSPVWTNVVAPTLTSYTGQKYLYLEGGYNDIIGGGQTVSQVEASYITLAGQGHALGAKTICDTDVIRNATLTVNQQIQTIAAWMKATPSVCDIVFDSQAYSVFNAPSGPWNLPWFEQQDGGNHMSAAGNALRAEMLVNLIQSKALFQ